MLATRLCIIIGCMFTLTFLGTSAASPSAHRGLSAHLLTYRQHRFLIDCGEGTQRQILRSGLGFARLNTFFLTHGHLDHIYGLGGLISTLTRWETLDEITIFGGKSTLARVHDIIFKVALRGNRPNVHINLVQVNNGDVLVEDEHLKVTAFSVEHRGPGCLGFVFEEHRKRPFLAEKADALGVPFGPERGQLVRGETITLQDGTDVTPEMVLGPEMPGLKYVHVGDVGRTDTLLDYCQDANALTIEATYTEADRQMAHDFGHLTAAMGATLAREANVNKLLLTHLSRRYFERDIRHEARDIFPNTHVARDFDQFEIGRTEITYKNLLQE